MEQKPQAVAIRFSDSPDPLPLPSRSRPLQAVWVRKNISGPSVFRQYNCYRKIKRGYPPQSFLLNSLPQPPSDNNTEDMWKPAGASSSRCGDNVSSTARRHPDDRRRHHVRVEEKIGRRVVKPLVVILLRGINMNRKRSLSELACFFRANELEIMSLQYLFYFLGGDLALVSHPQTRKWNAGKMQVE